MGQMTVSDILTPADHEKALKELVAETVDSQFPLPGHATPA